MTGELSEVAKRQERVLALRAAGMTFQAIADQEVREGGKRRSAGAVAMDVTRALKARREQVSEHVDLFSQLEVERLDSLQRAAEQLLRASQGGRCNTCGRGGDPAGALKAMDRLLRIAERRARLLGLDKDRSAAPQQSSPLADARRRTNAKLKLVQ